LKGRPGFIATETDSRGRWINGAAHQYQAPEDGNTLVTTLDANVQLIAERGVEQVRLATEAKRVAIIVEDMKGGILAFAQYPTYDPNNYQDYKATDRRPWPLADTLYPGSVFKMITAAAALQEGSVRPGDIFYDPGSIKVGDHTFHNWDGAGLGSPDLATVIEKSSNVGFVQIGLALGLDNFYKYADLFNLDEPTGIDLPGEGRGLMPPRQRATKVDLAAMSFGQTLTVTPIAMLNAATAIANGGELTRPHFGMELRTPAGQLLRQLEPDPVREVLSPETTRTLSGMLERVISRGTGKMAHVNGYRLAGKTGTAQKNVNGRVSNDKHTAAFVGYGPVDDPKSAVAIVIDEPGPHVPYYGGQIAAPVFGVVTGDLLRYLEIPPTEPKTVKPGEAPRPEPETAEVPSLVNLPVEEARQVAWSAGFSLKVEGGYPIITGQVPPAGAKLVKGSTLLVQANEAGTTLYGEVRVPDLTGKTLREAASVLATMNLRLAPDGNGLATRQDPAPGTLVAPGSAVRVTFQALSASP
ncbi:MAG: penicillin-binding transpeptidase domain-containing protein, partial [Firmicutes bacterium]|nr:penicillin-binding transpeptidase domain-containing protein [Bacillota bacterium]